MESPNPYPRSKRKRRPGPTEAISAPPTRAAYKDSSWKTEAFYAFLKQFPEVLKSHFPDVGAFFDFNSDTLEVYLQTCYEAKSDIERMKCKSILDSAPPKGSWKLPSKLLLGNEARESFLKGFSVEYKDDCSCLKTFTSFIDNCVAEWRRNKYLAPYTSLVQSSGTGKSRLVKEFANDRYVIYCCLRERGSSGNPARSWIADDLVPASRRNDDDEKSTGFLLYALFFCACMDHLACFVNSDGIRTASAWCKTQLVEEEESGKTNVSGVVSNVSGVVFWKEVRERMTVFETTVLGEYTIKDGKPFTDLLKNHIRSSCEKLVESFRKVGFDTNGKALLTFALDKSSSLFGEYGGTTYFSIFRWMSSLLHEGCGIFIVLLDTTSKISNFIPSKIPEKSFRYSLAGNELLPAFYAVDTFNILAPEEKIWTVLGDSPCDLTSVLLKHFMKGRPLFGSFIKSESYAKSSEVVRLADVVQLAVEKLLGGIPVEQDTQVNMDDNLAVALLSVRTAMFVKPQSELASSLVAKHLGMCLAISFDRCLVFTGYPSEPMLVEAACRIMNRPSKLDLGEILGPMLPYVREGIVEGGARYELRRWHEFFSS